MFQSFQMLDNFRLCNKYVIAYSLFRIVQQLLTGLTGGAMFGRGGGIPM